jgi:pyridoxamine 5'-phosphate oxidase
VSDVTGHAGPGLTEADLGSDPIVRFRAWLEEAQAAGIAFPEAAALATADPQGLPAVRHVLVKEVSDLGFAFFTNRESRKGRHLAGNPNASLAFLWREIDRQVCVTGIATAMDDEASSAYFRTRSREARIGAWASQQSRPVGSREELDAVYAEMAERFPTNDIPLPPHWGGYRLAPQTIEFWKGREHRLHDRFRFDRVGDGWAITRLWP